MNGVPVYPVPQNGERPYPGTPKMDFLGSWLGLFCPVFPYPTPRRHPRLRLLYIYFQEKVYVCLD